MTRYRTEMGLHFGGKLDDFDDRTDRLMDALVGMDGIIDPDLSVNLASGDVVVTMLVDGDGVLEASQKVYATVRAAIHAIGDSTTTWNDVRWDDPDDLRVHAVRDSELVNA